jgi:predicted RNA-binding protein (virulence factor B family)
MSRVPSVGQFHTLEVVKMLDFGLYLTAGREEILLPVKQIPAGTQIGDFLEVFIYRDSEDRLIATTSKPLATANSFACLRVTDTTAHGVFLDWGLEKDLFMPFAEQNKKLLPGRSYLVWVYVDQETDRLVCSARLEKFLSTDLPDDMHDDQEVDLIIWEFTQLGIKVVINNRYSGVLYHNEIFSPVHVGEHMKGYIKKIREDNRIDVSLRKKGYAEVLDAKEELLHLLKNNKGYLPLSDNSSPEDIYERVHMSKKTFKKAVGGLFKQGLITITKEGIYFITTE